ncbi:MAG: hypothetical protein JWP89_2679 [Schlesneria sp.]|nr:hypothetical protein [Schlesneria sp.]
MAKAHKAAFTAPQHLEPETRRWFEAVATEFVLEEHHLRLLALAGEAWDRCQAARLAIQTHGLTFNDRFGTPKARPEIAIERDSRIGFSRCVRELGLDLQEPESRPPRTGGRS